MTSILVCPDSFKGTFTAPEVAKALGDGVDEGGHEADLCPLADGGEGTARTILDSVGGSLRVARVRDPLGRPVEAEFGLVAGGTIAVLDVAAASGLSLVEPSLRDPVAASSYGTGELIAAAAAAGARSILVGAGGSATTDGGRGALEGLAAGGGLRGATVDILCDVITTFDKSAEVFAPQKGADPATVRDLTTRLGSFALELPADPRGLPMSGAAGGLAGGLWAALGARLLPGAARVFELVGFAQRLQKSASVITGEGCIDSQSFEGKVVGEVVRRCREARKPAHAVVGRDALSSTGGGPLPIEAISEARTLDEIREQGRRVAATYDSDRE